MVDPELAVEAGPHCSTGGREGGTGRVVYWVGYREGGIPGTVPDPGSGTGWALAIPYFCTGPYRVPRALQALPGPSAHPGSRTHRCPNIGEILYIIY